MLRLRASPLVMLLLGGCMTKPDPEPLSSYATERLTVTRGLDGHGTPIVYAYLVPSDDDCPPLARVDARIDGRTLLAYPGGDGGPGKTCFGAAFTAPIVVLRRDSDLHEVVIADETKSIRARVADLASGAELHAATESGGEVRVAFDRFVRGRIAEARATWSATIAGETAVDGDAVVARVPPEVHRAGRVVLTVDVVVELDVEACEGIRACDARWLVHEAFDVSVSAR